MKPLEELNLNLKEGEVEIEIKKKDPIKKLEGLIKLTNQEWVDEIIESPDLEPV